MKINSVREIFLQSQESSQSHKKLIRSLHKIFTKADPAAFNKEFIWCLKWCLHTGKCPTVQRTLDFVSKFVCALNEPNSLQKDDKDGNNDSTSSTQSDHQPNTEDKMVDEEDSPAFKFQMKVWNFLLGVHNSSNQYVRLHVCQLVNKLLNSMNEDAEIDTDLFSNLQLVMLKRIRDKVNAIRVEAVDALWRLQDSSSRNCPIFKAFMWHLNCDPHPEVRIRILNCVIPSKASLLQVLRHARDVKESVRKAAILFLANKVHIKSLTIAQRHQVLKDALRDRADIVTKACTTFLIPKWLEFCNGNIIELLNCLYVEDDPVLTKEVVVVLLKQQKLENVVASCDFLDENRIIKRDLLNANTVFYWRVVCEYLKDEDRKVTDHLAKVLPDVPPFTDFVEKYIKEDVGDNAIKTLEKHFVCEQLIGIFEMYDFADDVERRSLKEFVDTLLLFDDVPTVLLPSLIKLVRKYFLVPTEWLRYSINIIPKIREVVNVVEGGMTSVERRNNQLKIAKLKVDLNILRDELEAHIEKQNFSMAQDVKERITLLEKSLEEVTALQNPELKEVYEEKHDVVTLQKCLHIFCEVLQKKEVKAVWSIALSLTEHLVLTAIQNEDESVRNLAVKALGRACLSDKKLAETHMILLLKAWVSIFVPLEHMCDLLNGVYQGQINGPAVVVINLRCISLRWGTFPPLKPGGRVPTPGNFAMPHVCRFDSEIVSKTAIQAVFDILLINGLDLFLDDNNEPCDETNKSVMNETQSTDAMKLTHKILSVPLSMLDSEYREIHTVVAEGLGKLLYSRVIRSSKVLSRLIIMWYNPINKENCQLCNFLGVFFPAFASNRSNQELIMEAFLPTLNVLFDAPATSPLCKVDVMNVAKFMVELTRPFPVERSRLEDATVHDELCVIICNAVLKSKQLFKTTTLVKILKLLKMSGSDKILLKDIDVLCQEIIRRVDDRVCQRIMQKFHSDVVKLGKFEIAAEEMESGRLKENRSISFNGKQCSNVLQEKPLLENVKVELIDRFNESSDDEDPY